MGFRPLDQYSLLHWAVGIVAYFWNVGFWPAVLLHLAFELAENSGPGVRFLQYMTDKQRAYRLPWPGGKNESDSLLNQAGDNLVFAGGWLLAAWLDAYGKAHGWYYRTTGEY